MKNDSITRLSALRNELIQIEVPEYPNKFWPIIKSWIAKATPIIRRDWSDFIVDFQKVTAPESNRARFVSYIAGTFTMTEREHRHQWELDNIEAKEIQQNTIHFLDGLLTLPPCSNPSSTRKDSKKESDNQNSRISVIVAIIGFLAVCVAAIIGLGQPIVSRLVDIYFPVIASSPTANSTVTSTATWWVTPKVTATPLNVSLNTNTEILNVIKQLHPGICPTFNLAIETPPPVDVPPPPPLKFIEVENQPDPNSYYVEEIADNIDKSRQAVIACKPEKCEDDVYIKDNITGKVYKIDWGAMSWRPIQWLRWINKDTLMFVQSSNPHYGIFVAINFDKKEYQYYGMATDEYECSQSTPTP